jgi:hypothetical protein
VLLRGENTWVRVEICRWSGRWGLRCIVEGGIHE